MSQQRQQQGGWIKWTKDLETDSRVTRMARAYKRRVTTRNALRNAESSQSVTNGVTESTESVITLVTAVTTLVGALVRFWVHADSHVRTDNTLDMSFDEIDEHVGVPGFASSMPSDWLIQIDDTTVELPEFQQHNGMEAKKRALNAKRQSRHRSRNSVTGSVTTSVTSALLGALPRPDQTRPEETRQESSPDTSSQPDTSVGSSKSKSLAEARATPGLDLESFDRWVQYRTEVRKPLKPASLRAAALELAKHGGSQPQVVQQSIANGWQGLFALKTSRNGNGHAVSRKTKYQEALDRIPGVHDLPPMFDDQ